MKSKLIFSFPVMLLLTTYSTFGQWSTTKEQNLQLCDWGSSPFSATTDGEGGIYTVISKQYFTFGDTIFHIEPYLFKVDRYGNICWPEPLFIKGLGNWQDHVNLVPDNEDGVLAGYVDKKHLYYWQQVEPIYDWKYRIQKIDPDGNLLWGDGILAVNDICDHIYGSLISDGNGGCFVAIISDPVYWLDNNDTATVVIQHISSSGERLWGERGIEIWKGNLGYYVKPPFEIYLGLNNDVYFQNNVEPRNVSIHRYSYDGNELWTVSSRINCHETCLLPTKEDGLIFIGFHETNNVWNLAMDRIDNNGNFLWDSALVLIDSVGVESGLTTPLLFNNETFLLYWWNDNRAYIQKISFDGNIQYDHFGLQPCTWYSHGLALLESDGDFIAVDWGFAQKYTISGQPLWGSDGIWFSQIMREEEFIISDMNGGFISAWRNSDGVWAQQVNKEGHLGNILSIINFREKTFPKYIDVCQNYPNPFNNSTTILFTINYSSKAKLQIIDTLGKEVCMVEHYYEFPGTYDIKFNSSNISSGIYFYKITLFDDNDRVIQISDSKKMVLIK